ncbi:kinase-like domain-containing protein [Nemania abortiva]|nr:kinase-like domain-containing protein [Nemania abortiva]
MLADLMRRIGALTTLYMKPNSPNSTLSCGKSAFGSPSRPTPDNFDPYNYTGGCWMRNDAEQQQARHVVFNFPKLCEKAIESSPGARKIMQCDKVEGNFNRAFILHLDNDSKVVARIPFSVAGPTRLTTNSEVATMSYLRKNTSIPVPNVLDWSDNPNNPIGTEYIIMDHVPGVQLRRIWPEMTTHQHMLCVKNLTKLVKQMNDMEFPAYGSIFFCDGPIDTASYVQLTDEFCIGPSCDSRYWPCIPGDQRFYTRKPPNRGPWNSFNQYRQALLDAGLSRIPVKTPSQHLSYYGKVEDHLDLLDKAGSTLEALAQDPRVENLSAPMLLHPDLHMRNIFVDPEDPAHITALIDWQSTSLEPIFSYASVTPDLCTLPSSSEDIFGPSNYNGSDAKCKERLEKDVLICRQTWEVGLAGWGRKLHAARSLDENLIRPFRYCYSSWRDSIAALRHELIEVGQRWTELQLPGTPPYQPSKRELAMHAEQWEDFQAAVELREFLERALCSNGDGWVPMDRCEAAREAMKAARELWLAKCDEIGADDKTKLLWPYDL